MSNKGINKGLYVRYKKQVDFATLKKILGLMQLEFLGSFRECSDTSTQHFQILDTVDSERVARLQSCWTVTNGVISFCHKSVESP